uniref:Putative secreted protein n=1 Tax=Anopheles darlingi TaxID=43151 RepID=A0A2M4DL09_ANODA
MYDRRLAFWSRPRSIEFLLACSFFLLQLHQVQVTNTNIFMRCAIAVVSMNQDQKWNPSRLRLRAAPMLSLGSGMVSARNEPHLCYGYSHVS